MTTTATPPDLAMQPADHPSSARRRDRHIRRRRGRPNHRAVIGGVLVVLSALGLIALGQATGTDEPESWLVVTDAVGAGERIEARHLGRTDMTLHAGTERRAVNDPKDAIGQIALAPMALGDLVLRSVLADAGTDAAGGATRRVGLALDPADALNAQLTPGTRVDVLSADSDGVAATIARDALVTSVGSGGDEGVGSRTTVRVTLQVADLETAERLVGAASRNEVTLIAGGERGR